MEFHEHMLELLQGNPNKKWVLARLRAKVHRAQGVEIIDLLMVAICNPGPQDECYAGVSAKQKQICLWEQGIDRENPLLS
ncbi:hypothetical protein Cadr_000023548 [Camelus dromedarius]|uniref:Uncharacterized protein n=1 Tax=Camelus dromedarius TaxID=9838 RepID=A0A5N4CVV1_CAMDR|nr:hypothetical protein Cadr_000023548 [Camelus dromedarius]